MSDDLVFGNARQLRELAAALREDDGPTVSRARARAGTRVEAFRRQHPRADLDVMRGRPLCIGATAPAPPAPSDTAPVDRPRARVRVDAATSGPAELWIDDVIMWPNSWGEGISGRDVREALDDVDGGDVVVHMNSPGGDVFEGVAIYEAFRSHPGNVYVAVDALAASAASFIAMAGDRVGIGDMAMMMIHEASGFAYGNAEDMEAMATLLDTVSNQIARSYARRQPADSARDAAYYRALMEAETWMDTDRAMAEGLADERLATSLEPDPDEDDDGGEPPVDDEIANLFPHLHPAATAPTPVPEPDPTPDVNWGSLFTDDMEDQFT
jgi:ATP-dependent protease ClpP protease subunit